MAQPLTVYLDTQDYSVLADARAGRGSDSMREVLARLVDLKEAGLARFPYSVMNLNELLQYDGGGRELTMRKAETVEVIAGSHAFIFHQKLLAFHIAETAVRLGLLKRTWGPDSAVSDQHGWYPYVKLTPKDYRVDRAAIVEEEMSKYSTNRAQRRLVKARARKAKFGDVPPSLFGELEAKYPFSPALIRKTLPALLDGHISTEEAHRHLFREMSEPQKFVVWYFELQPGKKDFPEWLRSPGERMSESMLKMRERLGWNESDAKSAAFLRAALERNKRHLEPFSRIVSQVSEEATIYGITEAQIKDWSHVEFIEQVPYFKMLGAAFLDYMFEHSGHGKHPRNPKRSDLGDFFHALVLPYCDLWRGDAYMASLLGRHVQPGMGEIVDRLVDLPDAIERRLTARA